jgi:ParB family chromosome partitioning protein
MGHARAMVSIENVDQQLYIHKEIIAKELSVRKVEELVREIQAAGLKKPKNAVPEPISFQYQKVQDDLSSRFGTRVKLKMKGKKSGIIEIPFLSENDLNRLLELLDW